jgi:hypothetical protein
MSYPGSETSGDHGRHDLDFNSHPVDPAVIATSRGAIEKLQNHSLSAEEKQERREIEDRILTVKVKTGQAKNHERITK